MRNWLLGLVTGTAALTAVSAQAVTIDWTDWTTANPGAGTASGTLAGGTVAVGYAGSAFVFAQTAGGTFYYTEGAPAPYTSGDVDNAPPTSDILALSTGGTSTITFSQAVVDPVLALVSWNGNTVDFGTPIQIVSFGPGFWGSGTPILNGTGTGFFGSGEVHGVVRVLGTHNQIAFSHTSESWHGLTVGIAAVAAPPPQVSEAAPLALLGSALAAFGAVAARRQR